MRQHAHARMVLTARKAVHAVPEGHSACMCTAGSNVNPCLSRALSARAVERLVRENVRKAGRVPKAPAKQEKQVQKKRAQIHQLRALMKAGTLSQAVAQAAIEKAEEEVRAIERVQPAREEKDTARVIRMLPRAADVLRTRIRGGNLGLRDPRSIIPARNTVFAMFGGKVPLRPAVTRASEKPYLIARVGLKREVLLQAAAQAANCLEFGSGGLSCILNSIEQRLRFAGRLYCVPP